jgi:lipopolysaccharide biosynthesis regulator YciM
MRFVVFMFLVVFLGVISLVGYLSYLNPGDVSFSISPKSSFMLPTTTLVLTSMAFGGFMVILVAGYIETKHLAASWRLSRLKKRDARIAELLHQAMNAKASGRNEEAAGHFKKVLQIDSQHIPTLILLGDLYRTQGHAQEALRLHQTAKALDENNVEVLLSLSRDLEDDKRIDEAIVMLREVLKLDKDCLTAWTRLREIYVNLGRWEDAHGVQEKLLKGELSDEAIAVQRIWLEGIKYEVGRKLAEGRNYEQARQFFRGCIKLNKNYIPAYIGLGDTWMSEGKTAEAAKWWKESYDATGNVILLHRLEDLFLTIGQPARILQLYHEALQKDSANIILQFYLGKLYYRLEMVDEAVDVLTGIDLGDGHIPDVHKLLGNLYLQKGDLKASIEEFKKSINLKKRLLIPYYCPICDYHTTRWSGRCPRCGKWNTFIASPVIKKDVSDKDILRVRP